MSIIDCTSLWCNGGCGSWSENGRGFETAVSNISSGCGCGWNFNNCCCRDCRCGSSSNNCCCCDCDNGNSFAGGAFCGTINGTFRFF